MTAVARSSLLPEVKIPLALPVSKGGHGAQHIASVIDIYFDAYELSQAPCHPAL